jgi:hypothetical protein
MEFEKYKTKIKMCGAASHCYSQNEHKNSVMWD